MTTPKRIGLFYSPGPHFEKAARALLAAYSGAAITAIVPPGLTLPERVRDLVAETYVTEKTSYGLKDAAANFRLVRELRRRHFELFAVMFDSPRLCILAALSGARQSVAVTPDGYIRTLQGRLAAVPLGILWSAIKGHATYAALWLAVRAFPVRRKKQP